MARNPIRALSWGMTLVRRLSTAPATEGYKPLYRRLSALGGDPGGSVAATMNGWLKEGRVVTEMELMKFVRELRKYKSYKHALELMDWMETRGIRMSFSNHAVRLDLISKFKGINAAESYFSGLPELAKNRLTYGALLSSYCHEKMEDKAIALYEKMKDLNLASSRLVHNNLMTLYLKLGRPSKVQTVFQEMKANGIAPDNFTYCILMNSYALSNDIGSVEKVILEMKEGGLFLDWSIYSNLARHYNSAGLFKKTDSALKKVEELMDRRDRAPFHFLISLYAGCGDLAEVNRVWKSLKAAFATTTNMSYRVMLQALSRLGDVDAMQECFKEWESVYVTYDVSLVNLMIGAYLRNSDMKIEEAESLRVKAAEKGAGSDFRTLELFMDYYLQRGEMESALECFEAASSRVKREEWRPEKEKLIAYLKCFEEAEDVNGAEVLRKSLKKLNCVDDDDQSELCNSEFNKKARGVQGSGTNTHAQGLNITADACHN